MPVADGAPPGLGVSAAARTHVGRVRRRNEDAVLAGRQVWAVADGLGGHAAGDVASGLVVERLERLDAGPALRGGDLAAALAEANDDLLAHGRAHPAARGLGSTVTGLARVLVEGVEQWAVFNVGDSRVYRLAGGVLQRLTVDHSEVEELLRAGVLTPEAARTHPARHLVTRTVGASVSPVVDVLVVPQVPGERFLVCSDGLTTEVPDAELERLLRGEPDAAGAADRLVGAALAAGGRDNVSVVVVDVLGVASDADGADAAAQPRA